MTEYSATPRSFETLEVTDAPDRVVVTINRPDARNAINTTMVEELHEVLADLERTPRFAILTGGNDGIFAAGADITELLHRRRDGALAGTVVGLFDRLARAPLPTVAAIDGHALGGGAELAYACDLRIASSRARFGQPEPRLGIMAAAGGTWRLARLVGESLAKEILFTGRILSASEALDAHLVGNVVQPGELLTAAHSLVDRMTGLSHTALRLSKLCIDAAVGAHPTVDVLAQALLMEDEDKQRRMSDFLEKR